MEHSHHTQFTCPMHPDVIKDAPGKCPKCGMDLIPLAAKQTPHEHREHINRSTKQIESHAGHVGSAYSAH